MPHVLEGEHDAVQTRLAVVVSRFNSEITERLLAGALAAIGEAGGDTDTLPVAYVPGSLELPAAARKLAGSGQYDAVICLGCVIRGQTGHYDCVVDGARQGLVHVQAETAVPVIFGVLTTENREQAMERTDASRKTDAGANAGRAAIEMANLMKKL